jgi:hypothetical protein
MRIRGIATVALASLIVSAPSAAQDTVFRSDVGAILFAIRSDRAAAFEQVIEVVVAALRSGTRADASLPVFGLRVLKTGESANGVIQYLLLAEPPAPGVSDSLPKLISATMPERTAELIAQLDFATEGRPAVVLDLRTLQDLPRADLLRSRLDSILAAQLDPRAGPGNERVDPEVRRSMDRLRTVLWSVDEVGCRVVDGSGQTRRVEWSYTVRNLSLSDRLLADVTVQFVDKDGAVVHTFSGGYADVGPQAKHAASGVAQVPAATAARIVATTVRVEPRH